MLIARGAPRAEHSHAFKLGITFNLFDVGAAGGEGQKIGQVVLGTVGQKGLLTLREKNYTIGRANSESGAVVRTIAALAHGSLPAKAAPNPILLLDDAGQTLATAEPVFGGIEVSHDGQNYRYDKAGVFKTQWNLYPTDDVARIVGAVAKEKFFGSTVRLQFPADLDEAFQVFLFWLRLNAEMQAAASSGD